MQTRTEHDLLGAREVPKEAYYGIHALRAAENFPLLGHPLHAELINALALVKVACARANMHSGRLEARKGEAIVRAAEEVAAGALREQFIVDALQGGAGTSANMNMNEVLANRALEILGETRGRYDLLDPLDDVNLEQSTNDVFPTAVRVAALRLLLPVIEDFANLQAALQEKEEEYAALLALGRTEMQDAVPITVGQRFAAWAQAVQRDWWRLHVVEEKLRQVNLGGTAVGTGLNADREIYLRGGGLSPPGHQSQPGARGKHYRSHAECRCLCRGVRAVENRCRHAGKNRRRPAPAFFRAVRRDT